MTFAEVLDHWMGWILFVFGMVGVAWAEAFGHRCGGGGPTRKVEG